MPLAGFKPETFCSGKRQHAVNRNVLDHSAVGAAPRLITSGIQTNFPNKLTRFRRIPRPLTMKIDAFEECVDYSDGKMSLYSSGTAS